MFLIVVQAVASLAISSHCAANHYTFGTLNRQAARIAGLMSRSMKDLEMPDLVKDDYQRLYLSDQLVLRQIQIKVIRLFLFRVPLLLNAIRFKLRELPN